MGRYSYRLSHNVSGYAVQQVYVRDGAAMTKSPPLPSEVVLDCRSLQQRPQQHGKDQPVLLKALSDDGYAPRNRMVGWSYIFLAIGCFLVGSGSTMLVLALTREVNMVVLTGFYNMHTTLLGAGLLGLGLGCFLFALVKWHRHGHP
ncbi:uncharacterized protein LOC144173111 isoform X1 [Haemaphysalis longicornis]